MTPRDVAWTGSNCVRKSNLGLHMAFVGSTSSYEIATTGCETPSTRCCELWAQRFLGGTSPQTPHLFHTSGCCV